MDGLTRAAALRVVVKIAFGTSLGAAASGCARSGLADVLADTAGAGSPGGGTGARGGSGGADSLRGTGGAADVSDAASADIATPPLATTLADGSTDAADVLSDTESLDACVGPVQIGQGATTSEQVACCLEQMRAAFPDAGSVVPWGASSQLRDDPSLLNCCAAIVDGGLQTQFADPVDIAARSFVGFECCDALGWPENDQLPADAVYYCTPWGPPIPPDIGWTLSEVA